MHGCSLYMRGLDLYALTCDNLTCDNRGTNTSSSVNSGCPTLPSICRFKVSICDIKCYMLHESLVFRFYLVAAVPNSLLFLGRPGVGKTTVIREMARVLSDELHKRVVIVDTSNEIGGDGDVPHPAIGGARRMQVPDPSQQHKVMVRPMHLLAPLQLCLHGVLVCSVKRHQLTPVTCQGCLGCQCSSTDGLRSGIMLYNHHDRYRFKGNDTLERSALNSLLQYTLNAKMLKT